MSFRQQAVTHVRPHKTGSAGNNDSQGTPLSYYSSDDNDGEISHISSIGGLEPIMFTELVPATPDLRMKKSSHALIETSGKSKAYIDKSDEAVVVDC